MTTVGYETLEAKIAAGLEDVRAMADEQWDRCKDAIDMTWKMQRWLLGLLIGSIVFWAIAAPIPSAKRDPDPTVEEAVQIDE